MPNTELQKVRPQRSLEALLPSLGPDSLTQMEAGVPGGSRGQSPRARGGVQLVPPLLRGQASLLGHHLGTFSLSRFLPEPRPHQESLLQGRAV